MKYNFNGQCKCYPNFSWQYKIAQIKTSNIKNSAKQISKNNENKYDIFVRVHD